jgi:hypothetical protein
VVVQDRELDVLLRSLQRTKVSERLVFFENVKACRRRLPKRWQDTPLAKVLTMPDELHMLAFRAQQARIREAIASRGYQLIDTFKKYDLNNDRFLDVNDMMAAVLGLGIAGFTAKDCQELIDQANTTGAEHNMVDYNQFVQLFTEPMADRDAAVRPRSCTSSAFAHLLSCLPLSLTLFSFLRAHFAVHLLRVASFRVASRAGLVALRGRL